MHDYGFAETKAEMPEGNVGGHVQTVGRRGVLEF